MRRENRRKPQEEGLDFKKVLYIAGSILALAIIAFVITFFLYGNNSDNSTNLGKLNTDVRNTYTSNVTEQASNPMGKTVNEVKNSQTNVTNTNTTNSNTTKEDKVAVNTSNVETKQKEEKAKEDTKKEETKVADPTFKMPVTGDILREFAQNKLVYSNTLEEWITHNGIDIKSEKTEVVKASAEGTVKSIKNDPRFGLTVVIEHVNGFSTVYSNLLTAEFVVAGEKVKEGQTIGTVGNTATFEINDESHLHFEILKDKEQLDPELYLK